MGRNTKDRALLLLIAVLLLGSALWELLVPRASTAQWLTQMVLTALGVLFVAGTFFFLVSAFLQGRNAQQTLDLTMRPARPSKAATG